MLTRLSRQACIYMELHVCTVCMLWNVVYVVSSLGIIVVYTVTREFLLLAFITALFT